ncbi:hypothetical protein [Actinoplanes solisilvae]|uniref:hypothetical protein n=1 Tax=Actinoplanes solisilvae TaxID=2486853 RepID=UPI000FDB8F8D|nr:hypothetical protein [Actinoplanes solisilvae]
MTGSLPQCGRCRVTLDPDGTCWHCSRDDASKQLDVWPEQPPAVHYAPEPEHADSPETIVVATRRLPDEFWEARPLLKQIRQAAWATMTHPDAVLAAVLARSAGMVPHGVKFDSGRGPSGSMNLFACLLAGSGIGKSEASRAASELVKVPHPLGTLDGKADFEVFRDGVGVGTGEGLAEVFMGSKERDTGRVHKGGPLKGDPIMEKVRAQVRHNAYFYVDEGETLTKLMRDRQGAILGATLRTAWVGGTLGQANARDETTRMVPNGDYSMGLLVGFQPEVAAGLLSDVGPGTPQRFLWIGAQDTEMPEEDHEWPGPVDLPRWPKQGVVTFPPEIRQALRAQTRQKHLGEIEVDPLDSHEPLMRCKLAALLCLLDGRMHVDREDWRLSGLIWATSCAIRDSLLRFQQRQADEEAERQLERKTREARAVTAAGLQASAAVERVAGRLKAFAEDESLTLGEARRKLAGRDRPLFDAAVEHAVKQRWVWLDDNLLTAL